MVEHLRHLPKFFILGAQRTGTGSLTHYLEQHPAIHFTEPWDPAFFLKDELYEMGIAYYTRTFCHNAPQSDARDSTRNEKQAVSPQRWLGEATSSYFAVPHIVGPRLRSHYGETPLKFVVSLREPVSRAWSHYLSRLHHGCEKRELTTALAQESNEPQESEARYFGEGRYAHLLKEWQSYYPLENFLFMLSEDLAANPLAQARRIFMWLGVDTTLPINVNERLNSARYSVNPKMVEFVNHPPAWIKEISKQLWPQTWQRRRIRHHLRERFQTTYTTLPTLDPALAGQLRQRYRSDILALSKLLGRYLSHWLTDEEATEASVAQRDVDSSLHSRSPLNEKVIPRDARNGVIANDLDHTAQERQSPVL